MESWRLILSSHRGNQTQDSRRSANLEKPFHCQAAVVAAKRMTHKRESERGPARWRGPLPLSSCRIPRGQRSLDKTQVSWHQRPKDRAVLAACTEMKAPKAGRTEALSLCSLLSPQYLEQYKTYHGHSAKSVERINKWVTRAQGHFHSPGAASVIWGGSEKRRPVQTPQETGKTTCLRGWN